MGEGKIWVCSEGRPGREGGKRQAFNRVTPKGGVCWVKMRRVRPKARRWVRVGWCREERRGKEAFRRHPPESKCVGEDATRGSEE